MEGGGDNTAARQRGLPTYHQHQGREGGRQGREAGRREEEGYKNLIRRSFAEATFCVGLLFFLSFFFFLPLPVPLPSGTPQRYLRERGRQIFIGPN